MTDKPIALFAETVAFVNFSENLRHYRWKRGFSQLELARLSGVQQSTISRIEQGRTGWPNLWAAYRLACALRITINSLIERKSE